MMTGKHVKDCCTDVNRARLENGDTVNASNDHY